MAPLRTVGFSAILRAAGTMAMDLEDVIGSFYLAALEPQRWQESLQMLREIAGSQGAALMFGTPRTAQIGFAVGHSDESCIDYDGYYSGLDPLVPYGLARPVGSWCNDWRVAGPRFDHTEYYNDFFRRHEWHSCTAVVLKRDESFWAAASFQRMQGQAAFDRSDEDRLDLLVPHLQRAFRVYQDAEVLRQRASLAEAALCALNTAVWIVDGACRVLLSNPAADAQTAATGVFAMRGGELRPRHEAAANFQRAVRLAAAPANGVASWVQVGPQGWVATVVPLPPALRTSVTPGTAAAVLLRLAPPAQTLQLVLARLYGLTAREAAVAQQIAAGLQPKEVADQLSLTVETVRWYLKIIFSKTGYRRQADLVRALSGVVAMPPATPAG